MTAGCWCGTRRAPRPGPVNLGRHDGGVTAVAVLPDGRVVTGGGGDRRVLVWDQAGPEAGRVLVWDPADPGAGPVELGRHDGGVTAVAVLPDGRVVTGGGDRVLVWDPTRPGVGPVEFGRHAGGVGAVAVLPDGRVVTGGGDRVLVWDPTRPGVGPVEFGRHEGGVGAVAALADGRVVTSDYDGRVLVWDPADPAAARCPVELGRHAGGVTAVAALPDGRVVTGSGDDRRVLVWDPADPGAGPVNLGRHAGGVTAVAALPDGRVATGGGGRVLVWDPTRPRRPRLPRWLGVGGGGAAGRAGGHRRRRLGAGVGPAGPGARPVELGRHAGVRAVAALPDGRVATGNGDDRRVLVWDQAGPEAGRVLVWDPADPGADPVELGRHDGGVYAVAALPDGRVATSGDDDRVRLWDVQSSSPSSLLACSAYVLATSFSPSGARLFIGHARGGISCWEVRAAIQNTPGAQGVPQSLSCWS